jgi:hypothetical protein
MKCKWKKVQGRLILIISFYEHSPIVQTKSSSNILKMRKKGIRKYLILKEGDNKHSKSD